MRGEECGPCHVAKGNKCILDEWTPGDLQQRAVCNGECVDNDSCSVQFIVLVCSHLSVVRDNLRHVLYYI